MRDGFKALVGFVQDNHSRSRLGIVRGMHFQPRMESSCALWRILDVLVDLRRESTTFGRWEGDPAAEAASPTRP